jgi:3-methyladenine DNA glycosylase AlkD
MMSRVTNVPSVALHGCRIPDIRSYGAELARDRTLWEPLLFGSSPADDTMFEERVLRGVVLGKVKLPLAERWPLVKAYVPTLRSWGEVDCFTASYKPSKAELASVWHSLAPFAASGAEFQVRYALVMMNGYYVTDAHIDRVLSIVDGVKHPEYYVKMAQAWLLSTCVVKQPAKTLAYLQPGANTLEDWTMNKAVQKTLESFRVPDETKVAVRSLKRSPVVTGWVAMPVRTEDAAAPSPREPTRKKKATAAAAADGGENAAAAVGVACLSAEELTALFHDPPAPIGAGAGHGDAGTGADAGADKNV